jgi:hypothetical protein
VLPYSADGDIGPFSRSEHVDTYDERLPEILSRDGRGRRQTSGEFNVPV